MIPKATCMFCLCSTKPQRVREGESRVGSVEVEKYMEIEGFSHVMHIGSTIRGEIRKSCEIPLVFMTYANVVFSYGTE